jgi:hypothetical protein
MAVINMVAMGVFVSYVMVNDNLFPGNIQEFKAGPGAGLIQDVRETPDGSFSDPGYVY